MYKSESEVLSRGSHAMTNKNNSRQAESVLQALDNKAGQCTLSIDKQHGHSHMRPHLSHLWLIWFLIAYIHRSICILFNQMGCSNTVAHLHSCTQYAIAARYNLCSLERKKRTVLHLAKAALSQLVQSAVFTLAYLNACLQCQQCILCCKISILRLIRL